MPHPFNNTGYNPTVADKRNFILEKAQPVAPYPTSYKTDISALGVFDQSKIPDCVENAITKAHQYHLYKNGSLYNFSRRFLAYWTVKLDGFPISYGTSLLNGLKEAQKRGICEATLWPDDHTLDEDTFSTAVPSPTAMVNGTTHTISSYAFLSDRSEQGLKNAIYQNGLIIVAATIDKSWWTDVRGNVTWDARKILPLRPPVDTSSESGHAFILYGYDEDYFYVLNSFGVEWADKGTGYFSSAYLPYISEAATLIDLAPEQIAQLQQANQIVTTVDSLKKVETPQNTSLIESIITGLWTRLTSLFS